MKKVAPFIAFIASGILFVFPSFVNAEIIRNFTSEIGVFPDSSLLITEKITYDFEGALRHGIYRDIPLKNKDNESLEIEVLSVLDKDNKPYKFTTGVKDRVLSIKIGDADVIISGEKIYNITYKVLGAIDYYDEFDEIYWNVTGNEWGIPIESSEVKVTLPKDVFPKERKCYYGPIGSKSPCTVFDEKTFRVDRQLNKGDGVTVAVSFEKGAVLEYERKTDSVFLMIISTFWPVILSLVIWGIMFYRWLKRGRDPKGAGIIKPEYTAPKDLSPIEIGGIIHESIKARSISAQIIDLAIRGFIKIKPVETKLLGSSYKQDYEITLLVEVGFLDNNFDKEIIITIFGDNPTVGGVTMLSALNNLFYKSVPKISGQVVDSLLRKKYYSFLPKNIKLGVVLIIPIVFFSFYFVDFVMGFFFEKDAVTVIILVASFIFSLGIAIMFHLLMPAKTKKGVAMEEYLLGLKEYLQIAEKDRLAFHNAPEKKPETFETLLPYAIVFEVEELWAKEFEDVYKSEPEWFENGGSNFNVVSFGKNLSIFDTVLTSSISSTPSSSGSGDGGSSGTSSGSSGGGGGGGGGGSW